MTPQQIKESTTLELLIAYNNKARCYYCLSAAEAIYRELNKRLGSKVYNLHTEAWHMEHGEGDAMFNDECDKLIDEIKGE
jgi:hypothetical protein